MGGGVRYWVKVGFTEQRPVIPDQYVSLVELEAEDDTDAFMTAFHMVYGRPKVEMVTRCEILEVEL